MANFFITCPICKTVHMWVEDHQERRCPVCVETLSQGDTPIHRLKAWAHFKRIEMAGEGIDPEIKENNLQFASDLEWCLSQLEQLTKNLTHTE